MKISSNQGNFLGDVIKLVGGSALAQGLTILVAPILSRLYDPSDFGIAAIYISVVTIAGAISCLRYDFAVVIADDEDKAKDLFIISIVFAIIVAIFSGVTLKFIGQPLAKLLKTPDLTKYYWVLPFSILLHGLFLSFSSWNSRKKRFGKISLARISQSIAVNSVQVLSAVIVNPHAGGLIGAHISGSATAAIVLGKQAFSRNNIKIFRALKFKKILSVIKEYKKFPIFSIWSIMLNTISWQLPTFLLSTFFSAVVVGYYSFSARVISLPMSLVGTAIAQVFFQRASEANHQGTLTELVRNAYELLVVIGLFPLLTLAIVGKSIFVVIFGINWAEAGVYTQILSLWTFFWFISSPLSTLFSVLQRQEFDLKLNIIIFSTRLLSLIIGGLLGDARLALILFSISGIGVYGYLSFSIMSASGVSWSTIWRILFSNAILFVPAGIVLGILSLLEINYMSQLIWAILLNILYFVYIFRKNNVLRNLLSFEFVISPQD